MTRFFESDRCNFINDCRDETDEADCGKATLKKMVEECGGVLGKTNKHNSCCDHFGSISVFFCEKNV